MIGLYDSDGNRLAITINGLTLNSPSDDAETKIIVTDVRSKTSIQGKIEQRNDGRNGLEAPPPSKAGRVISLQGVISAANIEAFYDKVENMAAKLDPTLLARNNPSTDGFVNLNFTTPSAAGNLACKYKVRPVGMSEPILTSMFGVIQAPFKVDFLLADERRYLQAQSTLVGAGTATNTGDYPTWPTLTITMAGAGSGTYAWTVVGLGTLTLNLSGRIASDVVVVTPEIRSITVNGTAAPSLFVSGTWLDLSAGANTVSYANTTNATSTLTWYGAFAL